MVPLLSTLRHGLRCAQALLGRLRDRIRMSQSARDLPDAATLRDLGIDPCMWAAMHPRDFRGRLAARERQWAGEASASPP